MRLDRSLLLIAAVLLSACAPRLYQRETLTVDHRDLDQFEIRYADFDSCLLRRPVPVSWKLRRALYTMELDVHFGTDAQPATLDLNLSGSPDLSARFAELRTSPPATEVETGTRYRVNIPGSTLTISVLRGGTAVGEEVLRVGRDTCRALSVNEESAQR